MENKILTLLGFATRAGKLSFGAAKSEEQIKLKKSYLAVISNDISEKTKKEILFTANKNGVNAIVLENTDTSKLSNAVGRNCGVISVNDKSFASAITEEYGRKC